VEPEETFRSASWIVRYRPEPSAATVIVAAFEEVADRATATGVARAVTARPQSGFFSAGRTGG